MPPPFFSDFNAQQPPLMGDFMGMPQPPQMAAPFPPIPPQMLEAGGGPPRQIPIEPKKPTKKHQEEALEYARYWIKASSEYMRTKMPTLQLLDDLYHNDRPLSTWRIALSRLPYEKRKALNSWKCNLVIPAVTVTVNSFADRLYRSVFFSSEYCKVHPMPKPGRRSIEDEQFPTAKKLDRVILENFEEGFFKNSQKRAFTYLGLFGFMVSKVSWFLKKVPRFYQDPLTDEIFVENDTIIQCPLVNPIKPHRLLIDPNATDMNINRWSGVGHKTSISYYEALKRFDEGTWDLGKKEFLERWDPKEEAVHSYDDEVMEDQDRWQYQGQSRIAQIEVIECEMLIPKDKKLVEHKITLLQEHNPHVDGASALMVRLREGTPLELGYRQYVGAHFNPTGKPLGLGAAEPHLPLIHHQSELLAIMTDNAKIATQGQFQVRSGSRVSDFLRDHPGADVIEAGQAVTVSALDKDIKRMDAPNINMGPISEIYRFNDKLKEQAMMVSDTTLGLGQREKTAYETHTLEQASSTPLSNIADMIRESYLNPLGKIVAGLYQQFEMSDRQIVIEGPDGMPQVQEITTQEIKSGVYKIEFLLDTQDQLRIARVNAMTQLMPIMLQLDPMLMQLGKRMRWDLFIERLLDMAGMDRIGEFLSPMPPPPPMLPGGMGMPGMGPGPGLPPGAQPSQTPPPPDINLMPQIIQDQMRGGVQPAIPKPPGGMVR